MVLREEGGLQRGDRLSVLPRRQLGEGNQEVDGSKAEGPLRTFKYRHRYIAE